MSRTAVTIALLLAALLSVAAAVLLTGGGPGRGVVPARVIDFDPATIRNIQLVLPNGSLRDIAPLAPPTPDAGVCISVRRFDGARYTRRLDPAKYAGLLRDLAAAAPLGAGPIPDPRSAIALDFHLQDGTRRRVTFAQAPLAGSLSASIPVGDASVGVAVAADTFAAWSGDPAPLLDPAVFRWPGEPTALRLTRGPKDSAETLAFERSGRVWRMTAPVAAAADRPAVANLLAALSNLRLRSAAPPPLGVPPVAAARVAITFASAATTPDVQFLDILGRTGEVEALYDGASGACTLTLRDPDLSHLFDDLTSFLSRQSLDRPAADIMGLLVRDPAEPLKPARAFRRRGEAWNEGDRPVPPAEARSLALFLETLGNTAAAAVSLTPPADAEPLALAAAVGLLDAALGEVEVSLANAPSAAAAGRTRKVLCLTVARVSRYYAIEADDPLVAWIRTAVP
jgi:hypothetical protein